MRMARSWMWGALAVGASGCAGGGSGTGDDGTTGTGCGAEDYFVEIGTGEFQYESLADGDVVTMIHGPQGGWHVWTSVVTHGSEPEVRIRPAIEAPDLGIRVTDPDLESFVALVYDDAACEGTHWGERAYLDTDRDSGPKGLEFVCSLDGQNLELTVEVADLVSGRSASGTVSVVAALDPVDVADCQ
jgi:hypothetical protein